MKTNTFLRKVQNYIDAQTASQIITRLKEKFKGGALKTSLKSVFDYISSFFLRNNKSPGLDESLSAAK